VATLVYGATLSTALGAGTDPSLVLTSPTDGVRVSITGQIFSQTVGTVISARIIPNLAAGAGSELMIGLSDDSPLGRDLAGSVVVLTDTAIQNSPAADISFAVGAFPASLGRQFFGVASNARAGANAFVGDVDGDGLPDLSMASTGLSPIDRSLARGAYQFLPGTVISGVFSGQAAGYDMAEALNNESP
jgi:hypothetical protein